MTSIVERRDKTFRPSGYCSCGDAFWLGRNNHQHYVADPVLGYSGHEDRIQRGQLIDLVQLIRKLREQGFCNNPIEEAREDG